MTDTEARQAAERIVALYEKGKASGGYDLIVARAYLSLSSPGGAQEENSSAGAALIAAVKDWAADSEGVPSDPSDARLLKALWSYEGDHTTPCPECDGECGEPCAPCTVEQAHRSLDAFIEEWNRKRGIRSVPPTPHPVEEGKER